ncbi:DUF6262 family protein [Niallia taxi]|uniref:DUF6262 family protein n=1 Tax=Niallia taxi TaxID=2499688 RepID=UPI0030084A37
MSNFNRKEQLKQLHAKRKQETKLKVDKAVKSLKSKKENINFNSVSKEAGISKTTLYKYPEYKNMINLYRKQQRDSYIQGETDRSQEVWNDYLKNQHEKLKRRE